MRWKVLWRGVLEWGADPLTGERQRRQHIYTNQGLLYAIALLLIAPLIIETILRLSDWVQNINLYSYRVPVMLHILQYLLAMTLLYALRHWRRWHTLWLALAVLTITSFSSTTTLLLGLNCGFLIFQLGFLPLSFVWLHQRAWLAFLLAIANLILAGITYLYAQSQTPRFPVPEEIAYYLRIGLTLLSAVILLAEMAYLLLITDAGERLRATWLRWSDLGSARYTSTREKQANRIANQVILAFIGLTLAVNIAHLLLTIGVLNIDARRFPMAPIVYMLPAMSLTIILVYIFRIRSRIGHNTAFEALAYATGLTFVFYNSLLQERSLGYQYVLLPLTVAPIFFSEASSLVRLASMVCAPSLFLLREMLPPAGYYPLPEGLGHLMGGFLRAANVFILSVLVLYLWIKARLAQRFAAIWKSWSAFGTGLFTSPFDKKYRQIQNQLILIFSVVVLLTLAITAVFVIVAVQHGISMVDYSWHYVPVITAQLVLHVVTLWLNRSHKSVIPVATCFATGIPLIGWVGISLQEEVMVHFFNLALLPLPYIAFARRFSINRILVVFGSLGVFAAIVGAHWFHMHYPPLMPLPIPWMVQFASYVVPAVLLLTFVIYFQYIWNINSQTENETENERRKADELLLNILPENVAYELRESGKTTPILFNSASVMFTDFAGFTKIAEQLSPQELIDELDKCFSYFDSVCDRYKLEKLKTIGDSFMAAGGIPVPNNTHAIDCCLAAIEIQSFMNQMKEIKAMQEHPYWELRLGINTGNLVAGVVGEKKFAYDVWGDTVNTASRMESSGVIGKINISAATYEQVKYLFACSHRGRVKAKNKGEIDMYLLEGIKPKYSVGGAGRVPNDRFREVYEKIARGGRFVPKGPVSPRQSITAVAADTL